MKPTFLTKKQREEQALERLNAKRSEEDVKKKGRFDGLMILLHFEFEFETFKLI